MRAGRAALHLVPDERSVLRIFHRVLGEELSDQGDPLRHLGRIRPGAAASFLDELSRAVSQKLGEVDVRTASLEVANGEEPGIEQVEVHLDLRQFAQLSEARQHVLALPGQELLHDLDLVEGVDGRVPVFFEQFDGEANRGEDRELVGEVVVVGVEAEGVQVCEELGPVCLAQQVEQGRPGLAEPAVGRVDVRLQNPVVSVFEQPVAQGRRDQLRTVDRFLSTSDSGPICCWNL